MAQQMLEVIYKKRHQNKYIADNGIKNPFSTLKSITNVYDMEVFLFGFASDLANMKYVTESFAQEVERPTGRAAFKRRWDRMCRQAELSQRKGSTCKQFHQSGGCTGNPAW